MIKRPRPPQFARECHSFDSPNTAAPSSGGHRHEEAPCDNSVCTDQYRERARNLALWLGGLSLSVQFLCAHGSLPFTPSHVLIPNLSRAYAL